MHRLLLSVADTPRGGGGGVSGQKKFCVPKIGLKCPASLINLIFSPEENFYDVGGWVGGWIGRPGLAKAPNEPLPPPGQ